MVLWCPLMEWQYLSAYLPLLGWVVDIAFGVLDDSVGVAPIDHFE